MFLGSLYCKQYGPRSAQGLFHGEIIHASPSKWSSRQLIYAAELVGLCTTWSLTANII